MRAAVRSAPPTTAAAMAVMAPRRRRTRRRSRARSGRSAWMVATSSASIGPSTLMHPPSARRASDMARKTIKVDYLARVEGEGALKVVVRDGKVQSAELSIFEPPRFFEAFLRGRDFNEA